MGSPALAEGVVFASWRRTLRWICSWQKEPHHSVAQASVGTLCGASALRCPILWHLAQLEPSRQGTPIGLQLEVRVKPKEGRWQTDLSRKLRAEVP
eukprot:scaffold427_cov344-Prasinococcus_capsulatus_cf.AAC.7